jgi:L-ascorbate metabolism protein UlaG (beta-lactamase superfamily)
MNENTIFTDPFFSDRAAAAGKEVKIKFNYANVPEKSVVLLTHNHYDHLDKDTIKELIKKNAVFLVPLKMKKCIESWGAKDVHELDWWDTISIGDIIYTFVPAQHWSLRLAPGNGSGKTLWGGWIIEGSKTVYFSGDTGYFRGFEEFGRRWDIDYALITAGSYDPRWFMHYAHMNPEEFIMAADDLGAKISIPMHVGTISLSNEPITYPLFVIDEYIKNTPEYSEKIKILRVGEYLKIHSTSFIFE